MLKAVELNREVTIAQFQEELERLRVCVAQRDSLEKELLSYKADKVTVDVLKMASHPLFSVKHLLLSHVFRLN